MATFEPTTPVDVDRPAAAAPLSALSQQHPWAFYEKVRTVGDISWDETSQSWLVSSYDLCREITRKDHVIWRSVNIPDERQMFGIALNDWVELFGFGSPHGLTIIEGEEHTVQHRWWMRTFSRAQLDSWKERYFAPIVEQRIARFSAAGRGELVSEIADVVPRQMIAALLGLDYQDMDLLDRLDSLYAARQQVIYAVRTGVAPPDDVVRSAAGFAQELHEALMPFVADSRPGVGGDDRPFLRHLWESAGALFGAEFDLLDVTNLASAVWEAGTGTTKNGAANLLYVMATTPHAREAVRTDTTDMTDRLVEESLRLFGPVVVNSRIAMEDVRLGGQLVRRNERVVMLNNAAGVDGAYHGCPFDVSLERPRPKDHFSFGQGRRSCPGQHLARAELDVIARVCAERMSGFALDPAQPAPALIGGLLRRWEPLHVTFAPSGE